MDSSRSRVALKDLMMLYFNRRLRRAAPDIRKLFDKVARLQRGAPEEAMLRATKFYGGGVLPNLLEHVGDLIHRMTESVMFNTGGYEAVSEKVFMALRALQRPYGFAREEAEQRASNAAYDGMSVEEFSAKLQPLLDRYVAEHKKLPTYNRAQSLAQRAAVALGSGRYEECEEALLQLKRRLGDWEVWTAFAHLFGDAEDSNPELDTARRLGTRCLSLCAKLLELKVTMDAIVYSFPELEEDYRGDPPRVVLHKFLILAFQYFHRMGNVLDSPVFEVPDFRAKEDPQTIEEAERLLDHYFYDARNLLRGFSPLLEGLSEMWSIPEVDRSTWFGLRSDLLEIKMALSQLARILR